MKTFFGWFFAALTVQVVIAGIVVMAHSMMIVYGVDPKMVTEFLKWGALFLVVSFFAGIIGLSIKETL